MSLDALKTLLADDMSAVNSVIETQLHSQVPFIDQLAGYIINSGGKRLRPMLTVLAGRASGATDRNVHEMAAIIEFIHTATLLHDDVVDESTLRRGRDTANALWGDHAPVLVGDFLYSRAFQMLVAIGSMEVMQIMADATNTISEGEVLQLLNQHDASTDEARYLQVIDNKTAKLFEAACASGAIIAGASNEQRDALADYGLKLGRAYQLIDDVLDYSASAEEMGKNLGDDLAEGKPTLPLIHVIKEGSQEQAELVRNAIKNGGLEQLDAVRAAIESTGALDYTARRAREEADLAIAALSTLPESAHRQAMQDLAEFTVARTY